MSELGGIRAESEGRILSGISTYPASKTVAAKRLARPHPEPSELLRSLFAGPAPIDLPGAGAGPALHVLDLTSILASSQVISSVLQMDQLLKTR